MDGLEQRYGVEGVGSREKELFNKLNAIGKGEPVLFAQAVDGNERTPIFKYSTKGASNRKYLR